MEKKIQAYDLPTRIFHWAFAGLFIIAFAIAKIMDDDSSLYSYHMLAGIFMSFLVFLRIIWGLLGSRYARFSSFRLSPTELINYFKSILSSKSKRYLGHNPASSYAAIIMFIFTIGLAVTGILMSKGINKHFFEEVHELCANGFMVMVIFHVVGVLYHQVKHQDGMIFSMLNGKKEEVEHSGPIETNHNIVSIILITLMISFAISLKNNYNPNTSVLNIFGTQLKLGEGEEGYSDKKEHSKREHNEDNEEDDD